MKKTLISIFCLTLITSQVALAKDYLYRELPKKTLEKLALSGDRHAPYFLDYVSKSREEKRRWLEVGVEMNEPQSMVTLAGYYKNDHPRKIELLKKASNLGHHRGTANLGILYRDHFKNKKEANKWFNISSKQEKINYHPFNSKINLSVSQIVNDDRKTSKAASRSQNKISSNQKGHSHSGRTHTHPLPKQGIKHRHGNGAYGVAMSGQRIVNNKQITSNKTIAKTTESNDNNIIITHGIKRLPLDKKYIIRDQNGCLHFNSRAYKDLKARGFGSLPIHRTGAKVKVFWTGKCVGGYASGKGQRIWTVNGRKKSPRSYIRNKLDQRTELYNYAVHIHNKNIKERKIAKKEAERKAKQMIVDKDLIKFAKKYNFNSLVKGSDVSAGWSPDDRSKVGVNGKGTVSLSLERSHEATASITGTFKNGRLIGNAKLKAYASKCYDRGFIFCSVSESDSTTINITPSSNIKKLANNAVDDMLPGMYRRASRTISRKNSYSAPSYTDNSSSISSGSSSSKGSSMRTWKCTFTCKGGSETEIQVSASSHNKAEDKSYKHAHKVCKYGQVVSHWGSGKIACR